MLTSSRPLRARVGMKSFRGLEASNLVTATVVFLSQVLSYICFLVYFVIIIIIIINIIVTLYQLDTLFLRSQ
jgi:hypothetical protein